MRIVYLLAEDLSEHPGLRHKIEGQISFWCAQGHEVYRVLHEQGIILGPDGREISQKETPKYFQTGKLGLLKRMSWQYRFITEALRKIKPDLTYSRYLFPAPNIGSIKKFSGKLVFEINSNDRSEYLQKSKATGVFNSIFRRRSLSGVDGFVFVTTELSCSKDFQGYSSESIVIGNGVNINDFKFSETVDNDHPQLVFIGSPGQSWHGLDKIKILAEYLEDCTINIVGPKYASCASVWGRVPPILSFMAIWPMKRRSVF